MANFNATLEQVEQMIQSSKLAQLQEAKRMLDDLCLPADFQEFAQNVGGWSFLAAIASGKPELEQKLMKQVILVHEGINRPAVSVYLQITIETRGSFPNFLISILS